MATPLISHLQATLAMDWAKPPLPIEQILSKACSLPFIDNHQHEIYLERIDTPLHQDTKRASAYQYALGQIRKMADENTRLTWEAMVSVQRTVLDRDDVGFREGDAFAKEGRECYLWFPDLEAMFRRKIEADAHSQCNAIAKAVRLYLDIIFFHPFPDGNARAARLWFEFILRREQVSLPSLCTLARLAKIPGSTSRYWAFVTLAGKLIINQGHE